MSTYGHVLIRGLQNIFIGTANKNIGLAQQKQNFQMYYAVVKYRLQKRERKKRIRCLVNFLLLKFKSLNIGTSQTLVVFVLIVSNFNIYVCHESTSKGLLHPYSVTELEYCGISDHFPVMCNIVVCKRHSRRFVSALFTFPLLSSALLCVRPTFVLTYLLKSQG